VIRCPACGAILAIHPNNLAVCGQCNKADSARGFYLVQIVEMEKQHGPGPES
jgi:hypothetical protein